MPKIPHISQRKKRFNIFSLDAITDPFNDLEDSMRATAAIATILNFAFVLCMNQAYTVTKEERLSNFTIVPDSAEFDATIPQNGYHNGIMDLSGEMS